MEGTHGQLGARLANGLSGDNAHGLAHGDRLAVSQRGAVALAAHAVLGPAVQHRADLDALHAPAGNQDVYKRQTWPIVPMLTWGFVLSNFSFAIGISSFYLQEKIFRLYKVHCTNKA